MHFNPDQSNKNQNRRGNGPQQPGPTPFGPDTGPSQPVPLDQLPPEVVEQILQQLGGSSAQNSGQSSQPDLYQFVRDVHQSIDYKDTIFNIANESRRVTGVGRVSVVRFYRGKYRIECISGQPSVNRRSNEIRLLTSLADKTLRTGQPFAYPSAKPLTSDQQTEDQEVPEGFPSPEEFLARDSSDAVETLPNQDSPQDQKSESSSADDLPPEIKNPLREYLGKGKARSVLIVPISEVETEVKRQIEDPSKTKKTKKKVLGGLIFEHFDQQLPLDPESELLFQVCQHSSDAYRRSLQHKQLFLYPLWRFIGKTKTVALTRRLPITILVAVACLVLSIALFWPTDFYVSCKGIIRPMERNRVYAEEEGRIYEILAKTGQSVQPGQILAKMKSPELEREVTRIQSEISKIQTQIRFKQRMLSGGSNRDQTAEAIPPVDVLKVQITGLEKELAILTARGENLLIRSPSAGVILTWQNEEELQGRPTPKGRLLFEIGKLNGQWELELNLPDKRIGHFLQAQSADNSHKVDFVLASEPNTKYLGKIDKIGNRTQLVQEDGQVLKLTATFEGQEIKVRRAQAEVTAKIYCGRSTQGYLWTHDVWEVAQKRVFFYLW